MGLLKALLGGGGTAFNRLAKTFSAVYDHINSYNLFSNLDDLYRAAWLLKYGVYDSIEKWHWSPVAKLFIPNYQTLGRITINEAMMIAMGKLSSASQSLPEEIQDRIEKIITGEKDYYDSERLIPLDLKNKLKP